MKKLIDTLKNIYSIEELRQRIFLTLGLLTVFRLGSYIVLPGVDATKLSDDPGGIFGMLNVFLGGAFQRASIFALGIMPYISASIVVQLLTVAVPYFQRMQKEGETGRRRLNQITRVLTIAITLAQAVGYLATAVPDEAISAGISKTFFVISSMIVLTAGTIFCMWLGEKITERGIGNGISMLIMIGIVSEFPGAIYGEALTRGLSGLLFFLLEVVALFFVVHAVVLLIQAVRRIPIQYARQVVTGGRKQTVQGQRSYIPIKVNSANVMPIIFAQSLMFLPSMIASIWADQSDIARAIAQTFNNGFTSWEYNVCFAFLIIVFTFFYTAIAINPNQMAEEMKRNGAFIPGEKPGEPTAEYISNVVDRITLPGALFLAAIAVMPAFAGMLGVSSKFAQFYGGTSLIIMVGVILDTLQQIESHLLMRHYDGMLETGNLQDQANMAAV